MREQIIERLKKKFPAYAERELRESYVSPRDKQTFEKFKNRLLNTAVNMIM